MKGGSVKDAFSRLKDIARRAKLKAVRIHCPFGSSCW